MTENFLVNVFLSGFLSGFESGFLSGILGGSGKYRNAEAVLEVLKHGDFVAVFKRCFANYPYARVVFFYELDFL